MYDSEDLKRIGWGLDGDATLNAKDRLDQEAAAKEEADILEAEVEQERQRRTPHTFLMNYQFRLYCTLCGVSHQRHDKWSTVR